MEFLALPNVVVRMAETFGKEPDQARDLLDRKTYGAGAHTVAPHRKNHQVSLAVPTHPKGTRVSASVGEDLANTG